MLQALALVGFAAVTQAPAPAVPEPALRLERSIELPDVAGRIDHLALDRARGRLFVAALENGTVEVVDLKAGTRVKRFTGLAEPQGIVFLEHLDRVAVACGGSGKLELFDADKLEPAGKVELGSDADNVRFDAAHERVIVAYGGGGLALVDAKTWTVAQRIELGAHPESFQLDARGATAYVNLPSARVVVLVDLEEGRELARVKVDGARKNYPMLWDERAHQVVLGCREPARLVFVDEERRAVAGDLELAGDVDDLFLDAERGRLYAACGAGVLEVFERDPAKHGVAAWRSRERIPTSDGARTCLFVPEEDRLYLARPKRGERAASIGVYAPR